MHSSGDIFDSSLSLARPFPHPTHQIDTKHDPSLSLYCFPTIPSPRGLSPELCLITPFSLTLGPHS